MDGNEDNETRHTHRGGMNKTPMNWKRAREIAATARDPIGKGKPIGNNTRLYYVPPSQPRGVDDYYTIRLHNNVIMEIYREGRYLFDAGWRTVTTKERLNKFMLGMITQKNWEWYMGNTKGKSEKWLDGVFEGEDGKFYSTKDQFRQALVFGSTKWHGKWPLFDFKGEPFNSVAGWC